MKIEACFDEGKDWSIVPFAEQLKVGDFINFLTRRGNKYYRIDGGSKKKVEVRDYKEVVLTPQECEICGRISLAARLKGKITCVYCVYNPAENNNKEQPVGQDEYYPW
jgi:hypothetical protein